MAIHPFNQLLVKRLGALEALNNRYTDIVPVNIDGEEKRGTFSLVFKAWDRLDEKFVALKFFDLDPQKKHQYRLVCFEREAEILFGIKGGYRCLQLESGVDTFALEFEIEGTQTSIPSKYFVTEWIDDDIDGYFLDNSAYDTISKLMMFREIVLAVRAIHVRSVFHRDLKSDNLRRHSQTEDRSAHVVVVDMGTAAMLDSEPVFPEAYASPVGFLRCSAPEAFCGFAGCRAIAKLQDIFSLGCLLYEMFSVDDYYHAFVTLNPNYSTRLSALAARLEIREAPGAKEIALWRREAGRLLSGLVPLEFSPLAHDVPLGVFQELQTLMGAMTAPNFVNRVHNLDFVLRRIDICLKIVESRRISMERSERARLRRLQRSDNSRALLVN